MPDKSLLELKCAFHLRDGPVPVLNLTHPYLNLILCVSPKPMSASGYCYYSYYTSRGNWFIFKKIVQATTESINSIL